MTCYLKESCLVFILLCFFLLVATCNDKTLWFENGGMKKSSLETLLSFLSVSMVVSFRILRFLVVRFNCAFLMKAGENF